MINLVDKNKENALVNAISSLQKQTIESRTNQAPSNLAISGRVEVDQINGTATYYDANNVLMQQVGYLPLTGKYGTLMYDSAGIPIQLTGQHPLDGHVNTWITRPGVNVVDKLIALGV